MSPRNRLFPRYPRSAVRPGDPGDLMTRPVGRWFPLPGPRHDVSGVRQPRFAEPGCAGAAHYALLEMARRTVGPERVARRAPPSACDPRLIPDGLEPCVLRSDGPISEGAARVSEVPRGALGDLRGRCLVSPCVRGLPARGREWRIAHRHGDETRLVNENHVRTKNRPKPGKVGPSTNRLVPRVDL